MVGWSFRDSSTNHTETPSPGTNIDLSELQAKQDGGDFLRAVAEAVLQLLMEADVVGDLSPANARILKWSLPGWEGANECERAVSRRRRSLR